MVISVAIGPDSKAQIWSLTASSEVRHFESMASAPVGTEESKRIVVTMQTGLLTSMVAVTNLFVFIGDVSKPTVVPHFLLTEYNPQPTGT
jgi:hypothetical protein